MTVDRTLFADSFSTLPAWPCPMCGKGYVHVSNDHFLDMETGPSRALHSHDDWDADWIDRRFVGLLICNFGNCGELVAIAGDVSVTETYEWDEHGEQTREFIDSFKPLSLSPAPLLIDPPAMTPTSVQECLYQASSLIWQSAEGSANQVRQALEFLMDELGIKKAAPPAYLSLHTRIEELRKSDPDNAEILLAVKWLGNSGSHAQGLTREDVFDAFDMIELVLVNLYDTTRADIMAKVRAVNTHKGPFKKS